MEGFHEDIQSKILSRVPDESVLNCKLVCKRWQQLLSNRKVSLGVFFSISCSQESFIQLYYADYDVIKSSIPEDEEEDEDEEEEEDEDEEEEEEKKGEEEVEEADDDGDDDEEEEEEEKEDFYKTKITKINLPPIKEEHEEHQVIVGSCNGLVCLAIPCKGGGFYDPVYICNPFTSEYTTLPRISTTTKYWDVVSGFGYLPSTNEYKVVRIMYPTEGLKKSGSSTQDRKIQVQIYTLGKGSCSGWRNLSAIPPLDSMYQEGTFADGSLYWKDYLNHKIVAFDLADEIFRVLPPPPCVQFPREEGTNFHLTMLGGYMCLVDHPEDDCIDIWSFKKNKHQGNQSSYGVKEQEYYHDWSWSKDFSIEWKQDGSFYMGLIWDHLKEQKC